MGYEPENTLRSFEKGIASGVDAIELDVYQCKTGELVVIHDDTVDRTTDGFGYVTDMPFTQLRELDAGKGEKIPTLQEVLDLVDRRVVVNIELKGAKTAGPVHEMIQAYVSRNNWTHSDFIVSSFNHYELQTFHTLNPQVRTGALITSIPLGYAEFGENLGAYSVNLCIEFISKEFVDDAHQRGLKVYVWTLKATHELARMRELGVDGIFTNYPDTVRL